MPNWLNPITDRLSSAYNAINDALKYQQPNMPSTEGPSKGFFQPQFGTLPTTTEKEPYRWAEWRTKAPLQEAAQYGLLANVMNQLRQSPNMGYFAPIRQQAHREFMEQTVPAIAERFAGSGAGLGQGAFADALRQGGVDLQSKLAALQGQYGTQLELERLKQLPQLFQLAQQPTFESGLVPQKPGIQYPETLASTIYNKATHGLERYGHHQNQAAISHAQQAAQSELQRDAQARQQAESVRLANRPVQKAISSNLYPQYKQHLATLDEAAAKNNQLRTALEVLPESAINDYIPRLLTSLNQPKKLKALIERILKAYGNRRIR